MNTGKTTKPAAPSVPFRAADFLRSEKDIADYIEAMLSDGEPRAVPIALRTVADAMGGMASLADKTAHRCVTTERISTRSHLSAPFE